MFKTTIGEHKMKNIISILILISMNLIGCGGGNTNPTNTDNIEESSSSSTITEVSSNSKESETIDLKNVISLSYQRVLKKTSSIVCIDDPKIDELTDSTFINLGCFFKSGNYYFILNNNSEYPIYNLKITSSNESFEVSPDSIGVLGFPGKSAGVTPIIRISVNHKSPLNTESESQALQRGLNTTTITLSGNVNNEDFNIQYLIGGTAKTIEARFDNSTDSCYVDGPMSINNVFYDNYVISFGAMNIEGEYSNRCTSHWMFGFYDTVKIHSVFGRTISYISNNMDMPNMIINDNTVTE